MDNTNANANTPPEQEQEQEQEQPRLQPKEQQQEPQRHSIYELDSQSIATTTAYMPVMGIETLADVSLRGIRHFRGKKLTSRQ